MREKPTPTALAQSIVPPQTAPEWETKPMLPGAGMVRMKVVSIAARVSSTPTQLGPMKRSP
jgi:hypothetical protein